MTKAKLIEKNGHDIVLEIEDGYSAVLLELPNGHDPETFFKATEAVDISKQTENEHSCSHAAPSKFDKFRVEKREHEGKSYKVIYGRVNETNRWETAAFGYPANVWEASVAKEHGKALGGIALQSAVAKTDAGGGEAGSKEKTLLEIDVDGVKKSIELEHVMKKDDPKHLVFGICLEPGVVDSQGDFETPETIQLAIHKFMYRMWKTPERAMVGSEHRNPIHGAVPVQCYQAPVDFYYPDTPETDEYLVKAGSWVLVCHIKDDIEFAKVQTGEYLGFSIQGEGKRVAV